MRILGKRLLIVTAHPDDESFLAAGTMHKNHKAGGKNYVFCATLGERGKSHLKPEPTITELKRIRKHELVNVSKLLGVTKFVLGNLPDGCVCFPKNKGVLRRKLVEFTTRVKPDIVLGFGRDGISGHKDHIAAGQIAEAVARKLRIPYLAFCMPPALQANQHHLRNRRRHGVYMKNHRSLESPDTVIAIDGKRKFKALKMHKSQLEDGNPFWGLPKSVARAHLRAEYFSVRNFAIINRSQTNF